MKKALLLASFFITTPVLIIFCVLYFSFLSFKQNQVSLSFAPTPSVAYAALPSIDSQFSDGITQNDARVEIVKQFFQKYNSPLLPFAQQVVDDADKYGLDFRLVPAIAMQESNLCLHPPTSSPYNCWGYGIYKGNTTTFSGYSEGIETVTKGLAIQYKQNGLSTPEEIMTKYTPSSNGSWAAGVSQFMNQLQ